MSGKPGSSGTPRAQSRRRATQCENLLGRTLRDGEYIIEAVLGQGGMGRVFLASHTTLFVPVAIKLATLYWGQQPVMEGDMYFSLVEPTIPAAQHPISGN